MRAAAERIWALKEDEERTLGVRGREEGRKSEGEGEKNIRDVFVDEIGEEGLNHAVLVAVGRTAGGDDGEERLVDALGVLSCIGVGLLGTDELAKDLHGGDLEEG